MMRALMMTERIINASIMDKLATDGHSPKSIDQFIMTHEVGH